MRNITNSLRNLLCLGLLSFGGNAIAQDDLDDILGEGSETTSSKEERKDLETEESSSATDLLLEDETTKQIIKTLQRKTFMKLKRWELSPHAASVINDPFLKRRIIGTGVAYNVTEIFAVEGMLDYGFELESDITELTSNLEEFNSVAPDISRILAFGDVSFVYSPIYGKAAVLGSKIVNFDVYGKFGMGMAQTKDDPGEEYDCPTDTQFCATQIQWHPTTTFGGGFRVIFNDSFAVRLEGRSLTYVETVNSDLLEMKNLFIVQGSASFFLPSIKQVQTVE